jgi:hypothetical protein
MNIKITTTNDLVFRCHKENIDLLKQRIKRLGFKIASIQNEKDTEVDYSKKPSIKGKVASWN